MFSNPLELIFKHFMVFEFILMKFFPSFDSAENIWWSLSFFHEFLSTAVSITMNI